MLNVRVIKNSIIFFLQSLLSLIISVFVNGYIAKQLGTERYGVFIFAFSFATVFTIFSDMGFHGWGVKQIASSREKTAEYLGDVFVLRTFFSAVTFLLFSLFIFFSSYPHLTRVVLYIAAASVLLVNVQFTNSWIVFEAHESVKFEGISNVGCRIIVALLSLYLMYYDYGVVPLAWAYLFGGVFQIFYGYYILKRKFFLPVVHFSLKKYFRQTKEALPFAFLSFFYIVYYEVDKIMLGLMQGDSAVGIYNAAASIGYRAAIISSAISIACMPAMIQYYKKSSELLASFINSLLPVLFVLGLPIAICGTIYARPIIDLIYHSPQYDPSIQTLQIIVWMIPLEFFSHFFRFALIACGKERVPVIIVGSGVVVNLLFNIFLIPAFSYDGAAFATVVTEMVLVVAMILYYHLTISPLSFAKKNMGVVIANMGLAFLLFTLTEFDWGFWGLLPGCLLYCTFLFLFRVVDRSMLDLLKYLFNKKQIPSS